jgi:hypothetical protein
VDADDLAAVDELLDAAALAGWRAEWHPLTAPSRGWRVVLLRPGMPGLAAFGATLPLAVSDLLLRV